MQDANMESMMEGREDSEGMRGGRGNEEEIEAKTTLVPLSLLGENPKEGEEVKVRIVAIHGDEAEVEPCYPEGEGERGEKGSVESDIDEADKTNRSRGRMASSY